MSTIGAVGSRSRNELEQAIDEFTDADWARLWKAARFYATYPVEPDQLIQEALLRAISGNRNCPTNVDVPKFLAEAMRSIANGGRSKVENRRVEVSLNDETRKDLEAITPKTPDLTPEERIISDEQCHNIETGILKLFEDDEAAQLLVLGMMDGVEGTELRELTDLDETSFNSKRRLVRRRIGKAFPNGWTS